MWSSIQLWVDPRQVQELDSKEVPKEMKEWEPQAM